MILWILLQLPSVQNFAKSKILESLSKQYEADWRVGNLRINFFDEVVLEDIAFDDRAGDTLLYADRLAIDIGLFSLFGKEIDIDDVVLSNAVVNIQQDAGGNFNFDFLIPDAKPKDSNSTKTVTPWTINLDHLDLKQTAITFATPSQVIKVKEQSLELSIDDFDLKNQKVNLAELNLNNPTVIVSTLAPSKSTEVFIMPDIGWEIGADDINIIDGRFQIDTLQLSDIDVALSELSLNKGKLDLSVDNISAGYTDQFVLNKLSGKVTVVESQIDIADLLVKTTNDSVEAAKVSVNLADESYSLASLRAEVSAKTISIFDDQLPKNIKPLNGVPVTLNATTLSSLNNRISSKGLLLNYGTALNVRGDVEIIPKKGESNQYINVDLTKLTVKIPQLKKVFTTIKFPKELDDYQTITINGRAKGTMSSLTINDLSIAIDDALDVKASGQVYNLNNPDRLRYDVNIKNFTSEIDKLPIPPNENLAMDSLGRLNFAGTLKGNLQNVAIDGRFDTDLGGLDADLTINIPTDINDISYKGELSLQEFDLGTLLKDDRLDKITIKTTLDGKGFDLANLDSEINGVISDFSYNGYTYSDITLDAVVSDNKVDGLISIDDENVKLRYEGNINLTKGKTVFDFIADIDTLNLQELGFLTNALGISGDIKSKFRLPLSSGERGLITITDFNMSNSQEVFHDDSISIGARKTADSTYVDLRSGFMDLDLDGKFGIRDLMKAFPELVSHHYQLDTDTTVVTMANSESITIKGQIKTLKPLDIFMDKSLVQAGLITVNTQFDFPKHSAKGSITIDSFFYTNIFSERIIIDLSSPQDDLNIDIAGTNNSIGNILIPSVGVENNISNQQIFSQFLAKDDDKLPKLQFSTMITPQEDHTRISMKDSLILNSKEWLASKGNEVKIYKDKFVINDLALTDNNEYISVNSETEKGQDLQIDFKNFNIGQFTTLLTSEPSKLVGNIDGSIEIKDMLSDIYYIVNLQVEDLVYDSTSVGVLKVVADDNPRSNKLTTEISLIGKNNDVRGGGFYNTATTAMDFSLDIDRFQMKLLDPFLSQIIKDSEGIITGQATLKGSATLPEVRGSMTFDDVVTTIVVNNARYGIDEHTMKFDNSSIDLGVLDIFDSQNNVATVTGKIYHSFLDDIELDIAIDSDKFMFLNTSSADNEVFHGKLVLDANATIMGPPSLMYVDVVAKTLEETKVTISPFSAERYLLQEDYITYGKPSDFEDRTNDYLLKLTRQFPFKVNLLLDANDNAELNFVVDPITGDKIVGKGNGNLRIKLEPDGNQEIFGTYVISDGAYTFSYGDFVSKDFKVKPGGTVKFNGSPLEAMLDISAIYNVYTTTYELIKNEISINDNEASAAKQRTNVEVYLSLNGTLDDPKILLDIRVPDLQSSNLVNSIDRKLNELRNDPNEMNNQVFGLLIFDSFLLSDNASSGFGNLGSNIALGSISSLISSQLNKLASNVIKGVDVNINVNSYDSEYANAGAGGNVTEIGLQVSKQLFNDRLSISAGGNFDLSQNSSGSGGSYSSFIGDFVLEYKLTENGQYRVRVFSKTDYDRLLNENNNKNGVSLFFNKSFDSKIHVGKQ